MPDGEAPHPRPRNLCGVCGEVPDENGAPLLGHDLGWFCSRCIAHIHGCTLCRRLHPLCTAPLPRETQSDDLTLHTLRTLIAQNVWAHDAGDRPALEWLDVLSNEDPATPPPRPPWRAPTWALPVEGADPRISVQDYEHYNDAPRGSPTPVDNLPDSWGPLTTMTLNNYGTNVVNLTTCRPFTFSWLVGDGDGGMGVVRGTYGGECGDFFHGSGALTEGAPERLMAAYLTWRGIPLPCSIAPLALRAQRPHVPPPRPGTHGNAAVARMLAGGAQHHSSSSSTRRTATITTLPPRSRATASSRATNVRALGPSGVDAPQSQTASTSCSLSASTPHATINSPHRPQADDATPTTGVAAPSGAGTPQNTRQERASKRAAQRHQPQHHALTAVREHRASPARSRAVLSPTNTAAVGTGT